MVQRDLLVNRHTATGSPIFVVGYQHSGTTLLQYMLGRHSEVYTSYFETKFFEHLRMIRTRFPDLESRASLADYARFVVDILYNGYAIKDGYTLGGEKLDRKLDVSETELEALVDRFEGCANHTSIFCAVHSLVARTKGKTRWVEKTPTHVYYVDDIVASIPNAVFVEMVRDPRDILASKKTRRRRAKEELRSGDRGGSIRRLALAYDPFLDTVSWKSAVRAGRKAAARYPDRFMRLRYEDLLVKPEGAIDHVCDFLGLVFEKEMLQLSGRGGAEPEKNINKRGVDPTRTGRWRRVLTPLDVAACQATGGNEMVPLDYVLVSVSMTARLAKWLFWPRSAASLAQRLGRKWRVGGPSYFFNVVGNWRQRWKALRAN